MDTTAHGTHTAHSEHTPMDLWRKTVQHVSLVAHNRLPTFLHGRMEAATAIVLAGKVHRNPTDAHLWQVEGSKGAIYDVNSACTCPDYPRAPGNYCKHRLAKGLFIRAQEAIAHELTLDPEEFLATSPRDTGTTSACEVPSQYVVTLQGKPFIRFAGLLQMAHERGLAQLAARWTYNDEQLSLAHAVALFEDGKRFEESGDASPANVHPQMQAHFRRVALTRAKARALRDALNVGLVAVEELAEF